MNEKIERPGCQLQRVNKRRSQDLKMDFLRFLEPTSEDYCEKFRHNRYIL